jgi:hypothetical protein
MFRIGFQQSQELEQESISGRMHASFSSFGGFFKSGMGQGGTSLLGSPISSTIPKRNCPGLAFSNHKSWSKKASV